MSDYLLIDGTQIPVTSELAQVVGLNEAIVLQEVYYWCKVNKRERRPSHDGYHWVYNSYREWQEKHFPWWSVSTIRRTFEKLEAKQLLVVGNFNKSKMDQTKWYRINFPVLAATIKSSPFAQNGQMDMLGLSKPIPEDNSKKNGKKEEGVLSGYPSDNPAPKPLSVSVPIVEPRDEGVSRFIDWYFERYVEHFGEPHPNIKSKQRIRVTETLAAFIDENDLDEGALQAMADAFFYNVDCDHNINLFATPGILENRYYESCY